MVMTAGFSPAGSFLGAFMLYPVFAAWAALTISVMGKQVKHDLIEACPLMRTKLT